MFVSSFNRTAAARPYRHHGLMGPAPLRRNRTMADLALDKLVCDARNLERILDNLQEGIIAHDMDRRIFFFNRKAEKITGFDRRDVVGKDCHEAFGFPFCGERCSFCEASPGFSDKAEYRINITTKSGEIRRVAMSVLEMLDENGRFAGVLASFTDETELMDLKIRTGRIKGFCNIIGKDSKMLRIFRQIRDVAAYDYPVPIFGETGTGKELVAEAIHNESHRGGGPFVPINCGALPESLIESELFGHVKGAFSGAVRDKKGRFELAHGGTIFLDEIGELSRHVQVKLLRLLQEGTFEKVGGEKTITVNVRVISATNRDLKQEVRRNHFREDLYYRLNVFPIHVPPLRERRNDIPLLVEHFLQEAERRYGQRTPRMSKRAVSLLMDYHWPGNVRELQNAIQYAIVKCSGSEIQPADLPLEINQVQARASRPGPSCKLSRKAVSAALEASGGNKAQAARQLGVGRATLYRFLNSQGQTC